MEVSIKRQVLDARYFYNHIEPCILNFFLTWSSAFRHRLVQGSSQLPLVGRSTSSVCRGLDVGMRRHDLDLSDCLGCVDVDVTDATNAGRIVVASNSSSDTTASQGSISAVLQHLATAHRSNPVCTQGVGDAYIGVLLREPGVYRGGRPLIQRLSYTISFGIQAVRLVAIVLFGLWFRPGCHRCGHLHRDRVWLCQTAASVFFVCAGLKQHTPGHFLSDFRRKTPDIDRKSRFNDNLPVSRLFILFVSLSRSMHLLLRRCSLILLLIATLLILFGSTKGFRMHDCKNFVR